MAYKYNLIVEIIFFLDWSHSLHILICNQQKILFRASEIRCFSFYHFYFPKNMAEQINLFKHH